MALAQMRNLQSFVQRFPSLRPPRFVCMAQGARDALEPDTTRLHRLKLHMVVLYAVRRLGSCLLVTQLLFAVVIFGRMAGDFHEQGGVCHGVAINLRQLPLAAHHSNTGEVERSVASTRTFKSEEDTRQRSARALPSDRIIASRQIRVSRCSASHRIDLTFAVLEFNLADLKRAEVFVVMVVDPASRAHDHFIVLGRGV